ncbi:unnamed protein product [Paramecium primaurelia]|uniref:Uncharacterized protein n=2 Tax=Paramecium TaxID=5884 RepID=A0A8S1XQ71_9CILI|nr:unnamed protein product [Paramecium primaurelia]CAD8203147.1 unnamed protein product [Paramecium pentaurelia]
MEIQQCLSFSSYLFLPNLDMSIQTILTPQTQNITQQQEQYRQKEKENKTINIKVKLSDLLPNDQNITLKEIQNDIQQIKNRYMKQIVN